MKKVRVGICGLGFMGLTHWNTYEKIKNAEVVAVATTKTGNLKSALLSTKGNIGNLKLPDSIHDVRIHKTFQELICDPSVDVVDITLPTPLHAEAALAALKKSKPVICEKPIALTLQETKKIINAFLEKKIPFYPAHCIRFWPAYIKAREIIQKKQFGKVLGAFFTRLAAMPEWTKNNWMNKMELSGSAAVDLHVHDADFIIYTFGMPNYVSSFTAGLYNGSHEHIFTVYHYNKHRQCLITAENGWMSAKGFPFTMGFRIEMENATMLFGCQSYPDRLTVCERNGKNHVIKTSTEDGYFQELAHFISCAAKRENSPIIPPEDAIKVIYVIQNELKSAANNGKCIKL